MADKFKLLGLIKSVEAKEKGAKRFVGIATSASMDMEGEVVDPDGLNWDYALKNGWLVDTHDMSTSARAVGIIEKVERDDDKWMIYGNFLDTPRADELYTVIKSAAELEHPMGLSIEGDPKNRVGHIITSADVINVAITPNPVNTDTKIEPLLKSLDKALNEVIVKGGLGVGAPTLPANTGGAALVTQSLQGNPAKQTINMEDVMTKESLKEFVDALSAEDKEALKAELTEAQEPEVEETEVEETEEPEPVEKGFEEYDPDDEADLDGDEEGDEGDEGDEDIEKEVDLREKLREILNIPASGGDLPAQTQLGEMDVDTIDVDVNDALNGMMGGVEDQLKSLEDKITELDETIKGLQASLQKGVDVIAETTKTTVELQKSFEALPINKAMPKSIQSRKADKMVNDQITLLKSRYGDDWGTVLTLKLRKALEVASKEKRFNDVDAIGNALLNLNHGQLPDNGLLVKHGIIS